MLALHGEVQQCTLFHETTSPDTNGNSLAAHQCYGIQLGPVEVSALFTQAFITRQLLSIALQCVRFFVRSWWGKGPVLIWLLGWAAFGTVCILRVLYAMI